MQKDSLSWDISCLSLWGVGSVGSSLDLRLILCHVRGWADFGVVWSTTEKIWLTSHGLLLSTDWTRLVVMEVAGFEKRTETLKASCGPEL